MNPIIIIINNTAVVIIITKALPSSTTSDNFHQVYHEASPDPGQKPESASSAQNLPAHINPHHRSLIWYFHFLPLLPLSPFSQPVSTTGPFLILLFSFPCTPFTFPDPHHIPVTSNISKLKYADQQQVLWKISFLESCGWSETLLGWLSNTQACWLR